MTNELSREIQEMCRNMGADVFGIADASGFLSPDYQGKRPQEVMPTVKSVIVIGVVLPRGTVRELPKGRAEYTNTLMAATAILRTIAFRTARVLEDQGYLASIIPVEGSEFGYWYADKDTLKADMSTKYAAYLAGLGRYGISNLLLLSNIGPGVRMTAVITDAPLDHGSPPEGLTDPGCKDCLRCIEACPAGALHADGSIEREKCRDYMFGVLNGLRCGICVKECMDRY